MTATGLHERLAAAGVHTLVAQFTNLHGVAKGKYLPLDQLDALLREGAGFSGPSIAGTGLPRTGPRSEYWGRGDPATATLLPWLPGHARIVCDGFVDGQPFEACPRQVLRRQLARLAGRGWRLATGIEPEFFLLRQVDGRWRPADAADRLDKPSYDLKSLPRQRDFLLALRRALEAAGLTVLQIDHEDAQGQYEVNFGFDEALRSADHLMLFKLAAHALAEERGLLFSMMPKPFSDQPGSGLHLHVSLWQGEIGAACNLFGRDPGPAGAAAGAEAALADAPAVAPLLSELGRQFVAGVLAHSAGLTALAAPTVNSYRRLGLRDSLSGTNWAPVWVAHGPNNRSALVRTLPGRFEWRLPDASANPYLVTAALVAAGLDGIDRALPWPSACEDDLFGIGAAEAARRGIARLPATLDAALDALQADTVLGDALGPVLTAQFLQLKRAECAEHAAHVSDWELARYADAF